MIGCVEVYSYKHSLCSGIELKVEFKLPNQILYRSRSADIVNTFSSHKVGGDFWEIAIQKLSDKNYLEDVARELIIKYIKKKYKTTTTDKNERKINELIKEVNTDFKVDIEYKEKATSKGDEN